MVFENLNSLETLQIQNNKLVRIPEEVMEPVMDTLRGVDIMGELASLPVFVCQTNISSFAVDIFSWFEMAETRVSAAYPNMIWKWNLWQFIWNVWCLYEYVWKEMLWIYQYTSVNPPPCPCLATDNPLVCSCELIWYPNLLQDLKERDEETNQKKRPMCTMPNEHREYFVQNMPLERMNCIGKINRADLSRMSGADATQATVASVGMLMLVGLTCMHLHGF